MIGTKTGCVLARAPCRAGQEGTTPSKRARCMLRPLPSASSAAAGRPVTARRVAASAANRQAKDSGSPSNGCFAPRIGRTVQLRNRLEADTAEDARKQSPFFSLEAPSNHGDVSRGAAVSFVDTSSFSVAISNGKWHLLACLGGRMLLGPRSVDDPGPMHRAFSALTRRRRLGSYALAPGDVEPWRSQIAAILPCPPRFRSARGLDTS